MQASVRSEFVNSATALTVKQDTTKKSEKNLKRKEKIGLSPHILVSWTYSRTML